MILPQTSSLVLALMVLSMLLLGAWASTFKAAGKWRYELFYLDFAFGLVVTAVIFAFTLGDRGFDGFSFIDDLQHAGKRQWLFAFLAGVVFNLGNVLLVAAMSVAGMAVSFPVSMGLALVISTLVGMLARVTGNPTMMVLGCLLILTSIIVNAVVYRIIGLQKHEQLARAGIAKSTRRPNPVKGIILAVISGILLGSYGGLMIKARETDLGLGPYASGTVFAVGIFLSTFVFSIFLMNLPVEGEPIDFTAFFSARPKQHAIGLIGGVIWFCGMLAGLVATSVPDQLMPLPAARFLLAQSSPIVAALIGILVWKELKGTDMRVKLLTALMILLFVGGLVMIGIAPGYLRKA